MQDVTSDLKRADEQMEKLEAASSKLWNLLSDTSAFLQFNWKVGLKIYKLEADYFTTALFFQADVVESSIEEKEHLLKSEKFDDDLSFVQALLLKQVSVFAKFDHIEKQ